MISRRFYRNLANLFELYLPLADTWTIFDNAATKTPSHRRRLPENFTVLKECESTQMATSRGNGAKGKVNARLALPAPLMRALARTAREARRKAALANLPVPVQSGSESRPRLQKV